MDSAYEGLSFILLQTAKPSVFFNALREKNQLHEKYPELQRMIGVPQNEEWHQEGDVWNHTMLVLDMAVSTGYRDRASDPFGFMIAILCHDMGKVECTEKINGKYHAYNHEEFSGPIAKPFLDRMGLSPKRKDYILNLVELHMKPHHTFTANSKIKKTNKMFYEAKEPYDLVLLAACDSEGCLPAKNVEAERRFLMDRLRIFNNTMKEPFVTKEDILDLGFQNKQQITEAEELALKLRLAGVKKSDALRQIGSIGKRPVQADREE